MRFGIVVCVMDRDEFDPAAREEREIGRTMISDRSDLGSIIAHVYRGEIDREVSWRERTDATTNWAVTIIAGILAYAFSSGEIADSIIVVAMLIGIVFLIIEVGDFNDMMSGNRVFGLCRRISLRMCLIPRRVLNNRIGDGN